MTRPLGTPIDYASIPFQMSMQTAGQAQTQYQADRADDILKQANDRRRSTSCSSSTRCSSRWPMPPNAETQSFHDTVTIMNELRDKIANFDDFFRPMRNYLLGAALLRHPVCAASGTCVRRDGWDRSAQ